MINNLAQVLSLLTDYKLEGERRFDGMFTPVLF